MRRGAVGSIGLRVGAKVTLSTTPLASATATESLCPLEGLRINANPRASREGGMRLLLLSTAATVGSSTVVAFALLATIARLLLLLTASGAASTPLRLLGMGRWKAVCAAAAGGGRCNEGVGGLDFGLVL
jgi:hypothetical protein